MAKIKFSQYAEHDVINLFCYSGTLPVTQGTIVKFVASGWRNDDTDTQFLGSVGATYNNVYSQRFGILPAVTAAGTGDLVAGMLLYDVREQDENGQLFKFFPRKAAEMNVALSGQAVPILTKGFVLISGTFNGPVTAGATAYPSGAGAITTTNTNQVQGSEVGKFYGATDSQGYALLRVNIGN